MDPKGRKMVSESSLSLKFQVVINHFITSLGLRATIITIYVNNTLSVLHTTTASQLTSQEHRALLKATCVSFSIQYYFG